MNTPETFDTDAVCADLNRITRYDWQYKHDPLHPTLDVFESTLPDIDAVRDFQAKLVDLGIHFSLLSSDTLKEPALTFTLRPEEAQKFITIHELSTITDIKWRMSKDGQSYQMAPVDMHKTEMLYTLFKKMGITPHAETDPNGYIITKLDPEMAEKFTSSPEQTAGLAEELENAAKPRHARS